MWVPLDKLKKRFSKNLAALGIEIAISIARIFVLSNYLYMITLNETQWEVMCQMLGGLTVVLILLMMFGPLVMDLIDIVQDVRAEKK